MAKHRFRVGDGMTAFSLTTVLLDATLEGAQSAQLRRPRPRLATSAILRHLPSASRKHQSFVDSVAMRTGQIDRKQPVGNRLGLPFVS
jgi:hypothetical protein